MDAKFAEYYKSLGMGAVLIEGMSALHEQLDRIVDDPPHDVVVSEYVDEEGQRLYTNALRSFYAQQQ